MVLFGNVRDAMVNETAELKFQTPPNPKLHSIEKLLISGVLLVCYYNESLGKWDYLSCNISTTFDIVQ
jgi:hypothetical protein